MLSEVSALPSEQLHTRDEFIYFIITKGSSCSYPLYSSDSLILWLKASATAMKTEHDH